MLLEFSGNSNGLWLAALFLGDSYHFNASFWSVAANVSKQRWKMRLHTLNTCPNSGSSGSAICANYAILTKSCLDWFNTSLHLVQPRIQFDFGHVFQYPQSPLLRFGLPILDFLDDLVFHFVLAVPCITPAVRSQLGIATFFPYVPDCGSLGLALLLGLPALIDCPIPLSLLSEPRLQSYCLGNVLVGNPLLVVGLVGMLL